MSSPDTALAQMHADWDAAYYERANEHCVQTASSAAPHCNTTPLLALHKSLCVCIAILIDRDALRGRRVSPRACIVFRRRGVKSSVGACMLHTSPFRARRAVRGAMGTHVRCRSATARCRGSRASLAACMTRGRLRAARANARNGFMSSLGLKVPALTTLTRKVRLAVSARVLFETVLRSTHRAYTATLTAQHALKGPSTATAMPLRHSLCLRAFSCSDVLCRAPAKSLCA